MVRSLNNGHFNRMGTFSRIAAESYPMSIKLVENNRRGGRTACSNQHPNKGQQWFCVILSKSYVNIELGGRGV
jgi:hypothetical protein